MNADFASSIDHTTALSKPTITSPNTNNNNNDSTLIVTGAKSVVDDATDDSINKGGRDNNTLNTEKPTKVIFNKNQILQHQVRQERQQEQPPDYHHNEKSVEKDADDAAVETSANQLNKASLASINKISNSITTCLTTSTSIATTTTTTTTTTAGASTLNHSLIKERGSNSSLKLCNICHQEILATKALEHQLNQQLEGNYHYNLNFNCNSSLKFLNSSSTLPSASTFASNDLPSAQYCQKCVLNAHISVNNDRNSRATSASNIISVDNFKQLCQKEQSGKSGQQEEEDNYSNLFWKFISNLPKSITQRRKSSSSVLNQEVIGYLEKKQRQLQREIEQQDSNANFHNNAHRIIVNELTDDDQTSRNYLNTSKFEFVKTNKRVDFVEQELAENNDENNKQSLRELTVLTATMNRSSGGGDKSSGETTYTTSKPPSQTHNNNNNNKTLANVESLQLKETSRVLRDDERSGRGEAAQFNDLFVKAGSQNQSDQQPIGSNELLNECNLSINNKRQQQQHFSRANAQQTGTQANKLSVATSLTTRSSVSSLSSCILSGGSSTTSEVRLQWGKKMDFLLSIIGFAVDLANIWRFPYLVYKNGGGVFFIPYIIMLIFGGIPLFFLELCLGQFVKKGPITVWNKICPSMKGVGYCSILVSWYVSFYYNVLIAWSVYFIYRSVLSFGDKMPWEDCDNSWNSKTTCVSISQLKDLCAVKNDTLEHCRKELFSSVNVTSPAAEFFVKELTQLDQSNGFDHMGYLRPELVVCLLIVYLLHFMSLFKGLETSGKVVWVTATAPYIILSILLVRGLFLPGAKMGIEYYLSPKLERLHDPQVWIDAAGQVFYSIGIGFGVHLTYASFNSHNNNCHRDCLMTSAVNAVTSAYSGLVVFVYLGYMAQNLGIEIDKVASEGYSLIFEVYPEALTTLPFARFWSILFFIMLLTLGIDSAMGGLESVITGLEDEFKFAKRLTRGQLTGLVIFSSFFPALLSCTQGGAYTIFWFDIYSAGVSLLFSALFETIGVVYFYGLKKFIPNVESMLGRKPHLFYILCWKYISPLFLSGVIIMSIYTATVPVYRNYTFPLWSIVLGWALAFSSVAAVPLFAIGHWISNWNNKTILDSPEKRKRDRSSASSSSRRSPNHRPVSVSCGNYAQGGSSGITTTTTILNYQQNML